MSVETPTVNDSPAKKLAAGVEIAPPSGNGAEHAEAKNGSNGCESEKTNGAADSEKPAVVSEGEADLAKEDEASKESALESGKRLLAAGKRHLIVKDVALAVEALGDACGLLASHYGEAAEEMGEVYFQYGRALLELARTEDGVIDGNIAKMDEDDDDDDDDEGGDEGEQEQGVEAADAEANAEEEVEAPAADGEGDVAAEEAPKEPQAGCSDDKIVDFNDEKEADTTADESQDNGEEPTNLQLAWEMFELARKCLKIRADNLPAEDKERMLVEDMLSETYSLLGEVSIENENFDQAVEDLTTCLRRRQELMPEDSRSIAEAHFQLGVALGFSTQFDLAVDNLNEAVAVLEKRVANLKKGSQDDAASNEIKEIEALIPDIREKVADTLNMKEETLSKINAFKDKAAEAALQNGNGETNGHAKAAAEPAKDITSLVRKRKKSAEEADEEDAVNGKKAHIEEAASSTEAN